MMLVTAIRVVVQLTRTTEIDPFLGGSVVYEVRIDGRRVGWVGDVREWKGWRYGGQRWWAAHREDGDTAARWRSELTLDTRRAAVAELIERAAFGETEDRRPEK